MKMYSIIKYKNIFKMTYEKYIERRMSKKIKIYIKKYMLGDDKKKKFYKRKIYMMYKKKNFALLLNTMTKQNYIYIVNTIPNFLLNLLIKNKNNILTEKNYRIFIEVVLIYTQNYTNNMLRNIEKNISFEIFLKNMYKCQNENIDFIYLILEKDQPILYNKLIEYFNKKEAKLISQKIYDNIKTKKQSQLRKKI